MKKGRRRKKRDPPHPSLLGREPIRQSGIRPSTQTLQSAGNRLSSSVIPVDDLQRLVLLPFLLCGFWFVGYFFFFFFFLGRDLLTEQIFRSAAYMTDDVCPHPLSALNHPKVEWGGGERDKTREKKWVATVALSGNQLKICVKHVSPFMELLAFWIANIINIIMLLLLWSWIIGSVHAGVTSN